MNKGRLKGECFQTACRVGNEGLALVALVNRHHFGQHAADGADAGVVGGV